MPFIAVPAFFENQVITGIIIVMPTANTTKLADATNNAAAPTNIIGPAAPKAHNTTVNPARPTANAATDDHIFF